MAEYRKQEVTNRIIWTGVALTAIGLVFGANMQKLLGHLTPGARIIVQSMGSDSTVHEYLSGLPDGSEQFYAQTINRSLQGVVKKNGEPIRGKKKPHHHVEWALGLSYESELWGR